MTTTIPGQLEIDHERGVIYFHIIDKKLIEDYGTMTLLRICQLPPIPPKFDDSYPLLDVTHIIGASWSKAGAVQFEYQTRHFGTNSGHWLDQEGKEGWELVSCEPYNPGPGMTCVFKRRKR